MFRSLPSYIFVSPILLWTIPFYFPDYVKVPSLLLFLFPYYVWNRSFLFPITCLGPFLPTFSYPLFCLESFLPVSFTKFGPLPSCFLYHVKVFSFLYIFLSLIMSGTLPSCCTMYIFEIHTSFLLLCRVFTIPGFLFTPCLFWYSLAVSQLFWPCPILPLLVCVSVYQLFFCWCWFWWGRGQEPFFLLLWLSQRGIRLRGVRNIKDDLWHLQNLKWKSMLVPLIPVPV